MAEGIEQGVYLNHYPWVSQEGRQYCERWGFRISESVLQGTTIWEVESSSEEEGVTSGEVEQPVAAKARPSEPPSIPKAKAPLISKAKAPVISKAKAPVISKSASLVRDEGTSFPKHSEGGASSSRLRATPKSAGIGTSGAAESSGSSAAAVEEPRPRIPPVPPKAKSAGTQSLRPRDILPDTVLWFEKDSSRVQTSTGRQVPFAESRCYREYQAYKTYQSSSNDPSFPRFILFLDWHQVLDRSATEGSWNSTFPADSVRFLKEIKDIAERKWGNKDGLLICVVTHIEESSKNLRNVIDTCNNLQDLRTGELITSIFVTRKRCGPTGKLATIKSFTRNFEVPCAIIDDNQEVIKECSEEIHTCHVKIRRKPFSYEAECVRNFLIEFLEPLERLFNRY